MSLHRSVFFSAIGRYGSLALQLLSIAILSRLLTPKEFGIYSAVMALMGLAQTLREFGGANYLIQKPSLSEHCIRTAFTVTFAISCSLAGVLFALRGGAAWFFAEDGLRDGIAICALNFLLLPVSVTLSALLRREMAFDAIAFCDLGANFVTAATSVALAAMGFGFMGPVWGSVAGNTAMVLLFLGCRRDMRIFRPCLRNWRDVVGFGAYSSATIIINILYQYAPQLILGRVLGFTAVGLYGRAVNVTQIFDKLVLDVLNPVIMPAISAQTRSGADLKRIYLDAIEMITALHWSFMLFVALMADPIVAILFGWQWTEVVPLVRILALASLSLFAACLTYPVLIAVGRVRDTLVLSLISVPPSLLAVFIASFFGIEAVAAVALIALPLQAFVALCFIRRRVGFRPADLVRATCKSALVAACTILGIVPTLAANGFDLAISHLGFFTATTGASAGWCLGLLITRHPLLAELRSTASRMQFAQRVLPPLRRRRKIVQTEG
jgi:O-antigen/teichoic acid export membrane protein